MAIITICRGTRSGGEALAVCLAEHLGYPLLGREVIHQAADDLALPCGEMIDAVERAPSRLKREGAERNAYVVALQTALGEHAAGGNLVYHGLAGQLLLRGLPAVCRVRLIAPLEMRLRGVMEKERTDRRGAEAFIRRVDAERARWVKLLYGERIEDPALYDVVINLEAVDLDAACALVATVVAQDEFAVTDGVRAHLRDFVLSCRVRTALLTTVETQGLRLNVVAQDGRIEVSGSAPALSGGETGNRIVTIARTVPGVADVRLKFDWFDPYP